MAASKTKVFVVGATGETGGSIVNGLLAAGDFEISALVRPESLSKPLVDKYRSAGVTIVPGSLSDPLESLTRAITGHPIVISAVGPTDQSTQMPLVHACAAAGTSRFLPCAYMPVLPPIGVHPLRDEKERVYNEMKKLKVPYTIVDVGWWYQLSIPRLESGKVDYLGKGLLMKEIYGDGKTASALTDLRDIGMWVARIVKDERTLNRYVLAYNEMWDLQGVFEAMESAAGGEKIPRVYVSKVEMGKRLEEARKLFEEANGDFMKMVPWVQGNYSNALHLRGDNTPENAKYLGYLTTNELYPGMKGRSFQEYLNDVVKGREKKVYEHWNF
ncbi:MAG: hypothetical protein Q9227_003718 [Pyrenula ochraceoflavens]